MAKAAGFQSLQRAYNGRQHWLLGGTAEHATSVVATSEDEGSGEPEGYKRFRGNHNITIPCVSSRYCAGARA